MINFIKKLFSKSEQILKNSIENLNNEYLQTLTNIENVLREGEIYPQANFVEIAIESLKSKNYAKFETEIKSVNFWGGSGAVWEVYFENPKLQKKFNLEMLKLISLMEKAKISNNSIRSLKKLFERET